MNRPHFRDGRPWMVDVGDKPVTAREAVAEGLVRLPPAAREALASGGAKGDPLQVAELAGIQAAKRTSELIPLCHPLSLDRVEVVAQQEGDLVRITARCRTSARTGVEMEALTAASVAALTVYDMLKGSTMGIEIERIRLLTKEGGASGAWHSTSDR